MSHRYESRYESYKKKISYSVSWDHDKYDNPEHHPEGRFKVVNESVGN